MTGEEHYLAAEAALNEAEYETGNPGRYAALLTSAQVHATLASVDAQNTNGRIAQQLLDGIKAAVDQAGAPATAAPEPAQ